MTSAPGANAEAVADHTVGLLLAAVRHVVAGDAAVRDRRWPSMRGRELAGLTVGLLGCGQVGVVTRRAARRLRHHRPRPRPVRRSRQLRSAGIEPLGLEELAGRADVLSLHLPGGKGPASSTTSCSTGCAREPCWSTRPGATCSTRRRWPGP